MRILITNDDGFAASGLAVLHRIALELTDDVWLIAPDSEQSGCGHGVTLHRPLYVQERGHKMMSINGTPSDCVMLGINEILKGQAPDIVLSGVNRGANLGDDVTYSGTVCAALEGYLAGITSIAFSQHYQVIERVPWHVSECYLLPVIRKLLALPRGKASCYNVNFPACDEGEDIKGIAVSVLGRRKIGGNLLSHLDEFNQRCYTIGKRRIEDSKVKGSDIHALYEGYITITPLSLDLTDAKLMREMHGLGL